MNKTNDKRKGLNYLFPFFTLLIMLIAGACTNQDNPSEFSQEDTEDATTNAIDDFANDDAEDLGMVAVISETSEGGRISDSDDRLQCAVITRTGTKEAGTIRIDFGIGCKDQRGRVRKGAILIDYVGAWAEPGSSLLYSFDNYSVNDIVLGGTRSVKNITTDPALLTFQVDVEDGTATWPDGRVATRRVHHRRVHERDVNNVLLRLIIYGTSEGNHRNGRGYYIEILEPLVYDRKCREEGVFIPVKGKKLIKHGDRQITVDYGDGRCDNIVTLININGRSKDINVGG